jgi:sugar phosphate isomerase/epimerase
VLQIAEAGLAFAEISICEPEVFRRHELGALQNIRDRYGLYYLVHGPEEGDAWNPRTLRADLLPRVHSILDCAGMVGAQIITIHFWLDARFISRSIIEEKIPILREMADRACARGLQLCIENLSEQPADFVPVFNAIATLGMTLDIGHAQLLTEVNQAHGFVRACPARIRHVHVHDNCGGNDPSDDLHLPPGDGTIDFKTVLGELRHAGYDHTVTLEVAPRYLPQSRDTLRRFWDAAGTGATEGLA